MKKLILFILVLATSMISWAKEVIQDYPEYRIPNLVSVEDMQSLLGKTYFYYPSFARFSVSESFLTGMFGDNPAFVTFKSIEGKTKKGKQSNKMEVLVSVQPIETYKENPSPHDFRFTYYSGDYNKKCNSYKNEFTYNELRLMDYEKWKIDNSQEIGTCFTDPIVKHFYKVIDVSLKNNFDVNTKLERLAKYLTVENSETGDKKTYFVDDASSNCFNEDKSGRYHTYLSKVEKPTNPEIKFGETTIVDSDKADDITKFSYIDNFINIIIYGDGKQFYFTLKNASETTQKVIWDEAVFVDYNGTSSKIMHNGIKYSQKENSQPASTIIRGASIDELACPIANVYYSESAKEWQTKSIYPSDGSKDEKQVQLMLPVQIKDITNEYIFIFNLKWEYNHPERLNIENLN